MKRFLLVLLLMLLCASAAFAQDDPSALYGCWRFADNNVMSTVLPGARPGGPLSEITFTFYPDGVVLVETPFETTEEMAYFLKYGGDLPDSYSTEMGEWRVKDGLLGLNAIGMSISEAPYDITNDTLTIYSAKGAVTTLQLVARVNTDDNLFSYEVLPDGTASITGCSFGNPFDPYLLQVPQLIDGYTVSAISAHAFENAYQLRGITFPPSLKSIGDSAFQGCARLEYYKIAYGKKMVSDTCALETIGENAFRYCAALTDIVLPESLRTIDSAAFEYCTSLEEVRFLGDESVQLGSRAFALCTALKSIRLPAQQTMISSGLFASCTGLEEIALPFTVQIIGENAFENCSALRSLSAGWQLRAIEKCAFLNCLALSDVRIDVGLSLVIKQQAFHNCLKLSGGEGLILLTSAVVGDEGANSIQITPGVYEISLGNVKSDSELTDTICRYTAVQPVQITNDLLADAYTAHETATTPVILNVFCLQPQQQLGKTFDIHIETNAVCSRVIVKDAAGTTIGLMTVENGLAICPVQPAAEGTYAFAFIPVSSAGKEGESVSYAISVIPHGQLTDPVFKNIQDGDNITASDMRIIWQGDPDTSVYLVSLYDETDRQWLYQQASNGQSCDLPLSGLKAGHDYTLEVYAVPVGAGVSSSACGYAVCRFSYRKLPAFDFTMISGNHAPGGDVTIALSAPCDENGEPFIADGYTIDISRWNYAAGKYELTGSKHILQPQKTSDLTVTLPGQYFAQSGEYELRASAAKYNTWGNHTPVTGYYQITAPAIYPDKSIVSAAAPGETIRVHGTFDGVIARIDMRLTDSAGQPAPFAMPGVQNLFSLSVVPLPGNAFSAYVTLHHQLPQGEYTLHIEGFSTVQAAQPAAAAAVALTVRPSAVHYVQFNDHGSYTTCSQAYGFCGDHDFRAAVEPSVQRLQLLVNGATVTTRLKPEAVLADGLQAFRHTVHISEGVTAIHFRTDSNDVGRSLLFYGITPVEKQTFTYVGPQGAPLLSLPDPFSATGLIAEPGAIAEVLGVCSDYLLIDYQGARYFIQNGGSTAYDVDLYTDQSAFETDETIMLSWDFIGVDTGLCSCFLRVVPLDNPGGLHTILPLTGKEFQQRCKDLTDLMRYEEGRYEISLVVYEGSALVAQDAVEITVMSDWAMDYVNRLVYAGGDLQQAFDRWRFTSVRTGEDRVNSGYLMMNYLLDHDGNYELASEFQYPMYQAALKAIKLDVVGTIELVLRNHDLAERTYYDILSQSYALQLNALGALHDESAALLGDSLFSQAGWDQVITEVLDSLADRYSSGASVDTLLKAFKDEEQLSSYLRLVTADENGAVVQHNFNFTNKSASFLYSYLDKNDLLKQEEALDFRKAYEKTVREQERIRSMNRIAGTMKFISVSTSAINAAITVHDTLASTQNLKQRAYENLLLMATGTDEYLQMLSAIAASAGNTPQTRTALHNYISDMSDATSLQVKNDLNALRELAGRQVDGQTAQEYLIGGLKLVSTGHGILKTLGYADGILASNPLTFLAYLSGAGVETYAEGSLHYSDLYKTAEVMYAVEQLYSVSLSALGDEIDRYKLSPAPGSARRIIMMISQLRSLKIIGEDAAKKFVDISLLKQVDKAVREEKLCYDLAFESVSMMDLLDDSIRSLVSGVPTPFSPAVMVLSKKLDQLLSPSPVVLLDGEPVPCKTTYDLAQYVYACGEDPLMIQVTKNGDQFIPVKDYSWYPLITEIVKILDSNYQSSGLSFDASHSYIDSFPIRIGSGAWLGREP